MAGETRADEGLRRLRAESDAVCGEIAQLGADDWDRPTNCDPWTLRVLVAHVVRGGESYLTSLERGRRGNLEPALTREQRAQRMQEIAAQPTDKIVSDLRAMTDLFEREFRALIPDQLDVLAMHPYGPRPARWFIEQRLAEVAFHRWDFHHSLGRAASLDEDTAAYLLPLLFGKNLPVMMGSDGPRGEGSFKFAVRGSRQAWQAVAGPGSMTVSRDAGSAVDVTMEGDAASLALLIYGRHTLAELDRSGKITVSGNRELAGRFNEIFRGP